MSLVEGVGIVILYIMAPIGAATSVYIFRAGWRQVSRQLRLGELCILQGEEVADEIRVPLLKPRVVK